MFSKTDADRILKRAAEIEGAEDGKALSPEEIRSIANEAGFGTAAVERALAEARQLAVRGTPPTPVTRSGLVIIRMSVSRTIPIELSSEQLMQVIRLFQPYREGTAHVHLEADRLTWKDRKGLVFTMWSAQGKTEIHVFVSKILIRRGRMMRWVRAAADRLESLTLLVGSGGYGAPPALP